MKLETVAALVWGMAALLGATALPATAAEVHERTFEVSPLVGAFLPDKNTRYNSFSFMTGVRAAVNNSPWWSLEGVVALSPGQSMETRTGMLESYDFQLAYDQQGEVNFFNTVFTKLSTTESTKESASSLFMAGGSVLLHLSDAQFRPFVSAGAGFLEDLASGEDAPSSPFSNLYWDLGAGIKYYRPSGFAFRLEMHDLIMLRDDLPRPNARAALLAAQRDLFTGGGLDGVFGREPYDPDELRGKRWLNNFGFSASVTFPFGWVWKDADGDAIENRFDRCPTTAPGVIVDVAGCGIDSDSDGVFDGIDECADTPIGATVDLLGCPSDTDGDGIFDGIDQCADTPVGATVNAQGCPSDTDGDGVLDGLDECNDTPLGAAIDEKGCVKDPVEARLLLGENIQVENVAFEPGTPELRPLSYHYVNKMGRLLERWTGHPDRPLRIELGVHTDGIGDKETNLDLSQRRAESIRKYLLETFASMGANNLVAVGYGESRPVADDATAEGRAANRRFEVRVLGPGDAPELYSPTRAFDEGFDLGDDPFPSPTAPDVDFPELPDEPEMPDIE